MIQSVYVCPRYPQKLIHRLGKSGSLWASPQVPTDPVSH
jgi:hypothetical protein